MEERWLRILGRERYKKVKDSRLFEVVEEVFDYPTLMALYDLINRGVIHIMHGVVAAGKEARIYWAEDKEGRDLAVKIFLVTAAEFRKSRLKYIESDPRFAGISRKPRELIRAWCAKEFRNMVRAYEAGVRVPKPIAFRGNVLVMEFISGPVRGRPAPLIKEAPPEDPEGAFKTVVEYIRRLFLKAELVHADLSEYNILNHDGELVIIDWGSAVVRDHPHALEFLEHDITTIYRFFKRLGVDTGDPRELYEELAGAI